MSRVDDDRDAARLAERLQLQKQQAEIKAKGRDASASTFSKLVKEGQQGAQQTQKRSTEQQQPATRLSSSILEEAMEQLMSSGQEQAKEGQAQTSARFSGKAFNDRLRQSAAGEGERAGESRAADEGREGTASAGRGQDARSASTRADARESDTKLALRGQDAKDADSALQGGGGATGEKGELATDQDSSQGGSGGDKKEGGGSQFGSGFRFNPALMAPVPVASPRDSGASERLRALANEIAQKIVERVRVGTNAAGSAEFQIDLRSNVLAGLSIKVSGGNGKIKATFSGSDREVMKLLKQQSEGLKAALAKRGLKLEELKIEERA